MAGHVTRALGLPAFALLLATSGENSAQTEDSSAEELTGTHDSAWARCHAVRFKQW